MSKASSAPRARSWPESTCSPGIRHGPAGPELRELAEEANRLNETCRIYVNLMAANVRRRLQSLTGNAGTAYRPGMGLAAYA